MNTSSKIGSTFAPDGVEIQYEVAGFGEPSLIFVHGWSCDRSYWRAQVDHFEQSRRVVAIDLAGHGKSGSGRSNWTMASFGEDVWAVARALQIQQAILVGHSLGGLVIAEAARLMPDCVLALIPVDSFLDVSRIWSEEELRAYLAPFCANFGKWTHELVRTYFPAHADPRLVEWVASDMATAEPKVAVAVLEQARRYNLSKALASVKVPMRLINGDIWTTNIEAARLFKPDIQLAVVPGVGHFLMMEKPGEFNSLLERAVLELTSE